MPEASQLCFRFVAGPAVPELRLVAPAPGVVPEIPKLPDEPAKETVPKPAPGRDPKLETEARGWLQALGLPEGAAKLRIVWNPRMRSTAGYARWPDWRVELNPKLVEFEGQVERTVKHELAHLMAYARANRRNIEPHGREWRTACAELGIADESARHTLPLPRRKQTRKFLYACPVCGLKVERVRRFKRHTACLSCCKQHNHGHYDPKFQFALVQGG